MFKSPTGNYQKNIEALLRFNGWRPKPAKFEANIRSTDTGSNRPQKMLHIIQKTNEMRYKGTEIKTNMSAASQIKSIAAPIKMTRKERRAQKEVTALREQAHCILPATTFKRIVTQEAANHTRQRLRFNADAVKALQVAAENELTNIFTGAAVVAGLSKRDTVTVEDMRNFMALRDI